MKPMNTEKLIKAIQSILENSEYFEYFFPHVSALGFDFGQSKIIMNLSYGERKVSFNVKGDKSNVEPDLWVILDGKSLVDFAFKNKPIEKISLETSARGQILDPVVERLILRCFHNSDAGPRNLEREELIYPALFSFQRPKITWQNALENIKVLHYEKYQKNFDVFVSSGLGDMDLESGYELIVIAPSSNSIIFGKELSGWCKHIADAGNKIVRGDWLEYEEGLIPGTNLAGFIIVEPVSFPEYFPIGDGVSEWNLLMGVTRPELAAAKSDGVDYVAEKIYASEYSGDISYPDRQSVV